MSGKELPGLKHEGLGGKNLSLREHQEEKLRIQLYYDKVTFPGPK